MHEKRTFPEHITPPSQPQSTLHLHPHRHTHFNPLPKKRLQKCSIAKYILRDLVICQSSTCVMNPWPMQTLHTGMWKGWLWAVVASTAKHWPNQWRWLPERWCHLCYTAKIEHVCGSQGHGAFRRSMGINVRVSPLSPEGTVTFKPVHLKHTRAGTGRYGHSGLPLAPGPSSSSKTRGRAAKQASCLWEFYTFLFSFSSLFWNVMSFISDHLFITITVIVIITTLTIIGVIMIH